MIGRESANAPATPHVFAHKPLHDLCCAVWSDDAAPKALTDIRYDRENLFFLTVQGVGVKASFIIPKCLIKFLEQLRGFSSQCVGAPFVFKLVVDLGHPQPPVVHIALQFTQRFWPRTNVPSGYTTESPESFHPMFS